MGAPCNIDMNTYADDEYIVGVDLANAEIARCAHIILPPLYQQVLLQWQEQQDLQP